MKKKLLILIFIIALVIIPVVLVKRDTKVLHTISYIINYEEYIFNQQIQDGKTINKPTNPTKEGYEFLGWYVGDIEYDFSKPVKENLTLQAKWKEVEKEDNKDEEKVTKYTVTFDSKGGSKVAKQTVEEGKKATEPKAPTKSGYTFKGWYLENTKYNFSNKVTKNLTLIAKWEKVEEKPIEQDKPQTIKYTVTFNANGGTSVSKQTIEKGKTATKPKAPTKTGYTFKGWLLNGKTFDFNTKITSNITLKADWKKNDVVKVDIVKDEGSSTGQYIIYVLLNGKRVAGTVDITNSKGVTKTVSIPATGLSRPEGSFKTVTNPKVK